jgi:hypothetical protein
MLKEWKSQKLTIFYIRQQRKYSSFSFEIFVLTLDSYLGVSILFHLVLVCWFSSTFFLFNVRIRNNDIKIAIKQNKLAHKQWKEAGKPKSPEHPLLLRKVETRKIYRTEIRKEESKRKHARHDRMNIR